MSRTLEFHRRLRAKAWRAAKPVKDKTLREIAYYSILRHLYELPRKRKQKPVTTPTQAQIEPPFEIYHDGMQIADKNGHICSAENPEIAKAILDALTAAAEVGEQDMESMMVAAATRDFKNITIERCAQVAKAAAAKALEDHQRCKDSKDAAVDHYLWCHDEAVAIEAAIRALKDKP